MPLRPLIVILVCVIFAAAMTIWLAVKFTALASGDQSVWIIVIPVTLGGFVAWRGIEFFQQRRDDHNDSPSQ